MKTVFEQSSSGLNVKCKLSDDRLKLFLDCTRDKEAESYTIDADSLLLILREFIDPKKLKHQALDSFAKLLNSG
ncbi:hypothetical protein OAO01_07985, partial [Oligoflexia bacterium]|nr:hypothetical protein [Oligoflexia bacterium]